MAMSIPAKVRRVLLHALLGLFTAFLFRSYIPIGAAFTLGFLVYEVNEDRHSHDRACMDLLGWLIGLGTAGSLEFAFAIVPRPPKQRQNGAKMGASFG